MHGLNRETENQETREGVELLPSSQQGRIEARRSTATVLASPSGRSGRESASPPSSSTKQAVATRIPSVSLTVGVYSAWQIILCCVVHTCSVTPTTFLTLSHVHALTPRWSLYLRACSGTGRARPTVRYMTKKGTQRRRNTTHTYVCL